MISADQVVMLAGASGALMLASNRLKGFGLGFELKIWMLLAWALIITALVLVGQHLPVGRFTG